MFLYSLLLALFKIPICRDLCSLILLKHIMSPSQSIVLHVALAVAVSIRCYETQHTFTVFRTRSDTTGPSLKRHSAVSFHYRYNGLLTLTLQYNRTLVRKVNDDEHYGTM